MAHNVQEKTKVTVRSPITEEDEEVAETICRLRLREI